MKKEFQKQSKIRSSLCKAQITLNEDRYDEALAILSRVTLDEINEVSEEELYAIGKLLICLKDIAQQKKEAIVAELKTVYASKRYLNSSCTVT